MSRIHPDVGGIEEVLDAFAEQYGDIVILPGTVDYTACFEDGNGNRKFPHMFHNGTHSSSAQQGTLQGEMGILGYVSVNGPAVTKFAFARSDSKKLKKSGGRPEVQPYGASMQALACLCARPLQSVALQELWIPGGRLGAQGFAKDPVKNLHLRTQQVVEKADYDFVYERGNSRSTNAFLYGGRDPELIQSKIALSSLWLSQMVDRGAGMLTTMDDAELVLMRDVFPADVLSGNADAIQKNSYRPWDSALHVPISVDFLAAKVTAYGR